MRLKSSQALVCSLVLWSAALPVNGFAPNGRCLRKCCSLVNHSRGRPFVPDKVHAESEGDSNEAESQTFDESQQMKSVSNLPVNEDQPANPYPIDVPSPILLSASMVLAIASTGSLFELMGGSPAFGFPVTAAIALVGLPSCLFLFNASVLKAKAETEEDDAVFLGKKK